MQRFLTILLGSILCVLTAAMHTNAQTTSEAEATYIVTFASTWSADTHPGFPANAHFSSLIGATHTISATFWLSGTLASAGMEQMAETGGTSTLRNEFTAAGAAVYQIIAGPALSTSPAQLSLPFTVRRSHPLVTLVSMIAPSPDWFVGVHDLALVDETGLWRDAIVVTLYPYDAGTDDGVAYTSPDQEPAVHHVIQQISGQMPFSAAPIGTFTFTRMKELYLPVVHGPATPE